MAARIARHRVERPAVVANRRGPSRCRPALPRPRRRGRRGGRGLSQLLGRKPAEQRPELPDADSGRRPATSRPPPSGARATPLILVSERGRLGHPPGDGARPAVPRRARLRQPGRARAPSEVVLMVAGCPVVVKSADALRRRPGGSGDRVTALDRLVAAVRSPDERLRRGGSPAARHASRSRAGASGGWRSWSVRARRASPAIPCRASRRR